MDIRLVPLYVAGVTARIGFANLKKLAQGELSFWETVELFTPSQFADLHPLVRALSIDPSEFTDCVITVKDYEAVWDQLRDIAAMNGDGYILTADRYLPPYIASFNEEEAAWRQQVFDLYHTMVDIDGKDYLQHLRDCLVSNYTSFMDVCYKPEDWEIPDPHELVAVDTSGVAVDPWIEIPSMLPRHVLGMPIEQLDLQQRTYGCLKRSQIKTVGQVLEMRKAELFALRNFGLKSLEDLQEELTRVFERCRCAPQASAQTLNDDAS